MSAPGLPLPEHQQQRVRALVASVGRLRAAELLGCPASTVARAGCGYGVRRGTAVVIEQALARLDAPPPPPAESSGRRSKSTP